MRRQPMRKGETVMSSKELLAILCLLDKTPDAVKRKFLIFLHQLQESEEKRLLAASSLRTDQLEVK